MFALAFALSGALLIQPQAAAPTISSEEMAQAEKVLSAMNRMIETIGTCERAFPPQVSSQVRDQIAAAGDGEAAGPSQTMLAAYDRGRASPEAATITLEQCSARLDTVRIEMEAIQTEVGADAAAN